MDTPGIVLDTNVLVAAVRSSLGASHRLLGLVGTGRFDLHLSVPLVLEYEQALKKLPDRFGLTSGEVDDIIDYLCRVAGRHRTHFLWRPFLRDPKDDMVLELAVTAQCGWIVTYNLSDFAGVEQFGIRPATPPDLLRRIGVLK
jgi:putative PIN family toxin of toxin-antitoxin system